MSRIRDHASIMTNLITGREVVKLVPELPDGVGITINICHIYDVMHVMPELG